VEWNRGLTTKGAGSRWKFGALSFVNGRVGRGSGILPRIARRGTEGCLLGGTVVGAGRGNFERSPDELKAIFRRSVAFATMLWYYMLRHIWLHHALCTLYSVLCTLYSVLCLVS
jgi:hypothetical protein